jgi:ABC-type amino acid transport substrate-binding protein
MIKDVTAAAATIGRQVEVITAGSYRDIDTAFAALVQKRADALLALRIVLRIRGEGTSKRPDPPRLGMAGRDLPRRTRGERGAS